MNAKLGLKMTDSFQRNATSGTESNERPSKSRSDELQHLLELAQPMISGFLRQSDPDQSQSVSTGLLRYETSEKLSEYFAGMFPASAAGVDGIMQFAQRILQKSVNTWSQGFMSHLYSSTNPVGVLSELLLAVLNTNVHIYETSPALSVVEKKVTKALAASFGLTNPYAGGVSQQGGSASNLTALVTARSVLYPDTKQEGMPAIRRRLVLFTSIAGHYSLDKAAQVCGLGAAAVWSVPVDAQGRMMVNELSVLIQKARAEEYEPFFVNATAGTTVLGSFDPLEEIASVCRHEKLWFHIDASWGGGVVFSSRQRHKMKGSELADSITFSPHKMLNVPITCSFLLVSDLRKLWKSNTLPAGYLFHEANGVEKDMLSPDGQEEYQGTWDIADMTLQCGRRGDSLKMAMGWIYYGTDGYEARVDHAFAVASQLANTIADSSAFTLITQRPVPCLSVCFYYGERGEKAKTTQRTKMITQRLRLLGFATEHSPPPGEPHLPHFLRVVVNLETQMSTVEALVDTMLKAGKEIDQEMEDFHSDANQLM